MMIFQAKYVLPFLASFAICVVFVSLLLKTRRRSSKRLGGVAIIAVFVLLVALNRDIVITRQIAGILLGSLLVLVFGLWDDLKNLNWKWQFALQIIIALAAVTLGVKSGLVSNPLGGSINLEGNAAYVAVFVVYFLLFLNSLNWLDGVDGLSSGITLMTLAIIFVLSFKPEVNQPATAIISVTAGGAILGFFAFNWKPSMIIAGTSGSWFFGFLLASLSIFAGAKIATVLMATLLPILDFFYVVWERYGAGHSIFIGGDNRHLHFKLLKLGLGERWIVLGMCITSLAIGIMALFLSSKGKLLFLLIFSATYFISLKAIEKRNLIRSEQDKKLTPAAKG